MYELWAKSIDLAAVKVDTVSDPDHPNIPKLTVHSIKQARTSVAMLKIIQLTVSRNACVNCLRLILRT